MEFIWHYQIGTVVHTYQTKTKTYQEEHLSISACNSFTSKNSVIDWIKKFSESLNNRLSDHLHENEKWQVKTVEIYTWFTQLAKSWIEYSHYEALMRIGKAINIDNLKVVDAFVQCSSSAVDTSSVFYQVNQIFHPRALCDIISLLISMMFANRADKKRMGNSLMARFWRGSATSNDDSKGKSDGFFNKSVRTISFLFKEYKSVRRFLHWCHSP